MFYQIKRVLRNLKDWLPVIVKDEHWDHDYMYKLLHRKLELKEKFFRSDNTHIEDWEKVADEIKEVKDALYRLMEDEYVTHEEVMNSTGAAIVKEQTLTERDLRIVFDGLKENSQNWWD